MADQDYKQFTQNETQRFSNMLCTLSNHSEQLVEEGKLNDGEYLESMNGLKAIYEFKQSEMFQRYLKFKYDKVKQSTIY